MSRPRFYCARLVPGVVTLDASESRHALQSLRLRAGEEVILFDGRGRVAHGVMLDEDAGHKKARGRSGPKACHATLRVERVLCEPPPSRTLTLIVAACKGARLAWMIEKLTELGTTRIVLTDFERSIVRLSGAHAHKCDRIALEATKQSQRVWRPEIVCGVPLVEAVSNHTHGKLLVAHPLAEAPALFTRLHAQDLADDHLSAVIGPEGGLTDGEIDALREVGGELVRLAPTILRVETAAVSLAANWAAQQSE